ncbi:PocR ligand-binding domain-containing protein [Thermodesulfobacteriota bacterium]
MELTNVATLEKWLKLEHEINKRSGMNASVFNKDGIRITDYKKWANDLCPVIKGNAKGQSYICAVAHQNLASMAMLSCKPVIDACDAGMMKIVVPIFLNSVFLGVAGGCGCLENSSEVDTFLIYKTIGLKEEKVIKLAEAIPHMTLQQAESHAEFIQNEINGIVKAWDNL